MPQLNDAQLIDMFSNPFMIEDKLDSIGGFWPNYKDICVDPVKGGKAELLEKGVMYFVKVLQKSETSSEQKKQLMELLIKIAQVKPLAVGVYVLGIASSCEAVPDLLLVDYFKVCAICSSSFSPSSDLEGNIFKSLTKIAKCDLPPLSVSDQSALLETINVCKDNVDKADIFGDESLQALAKISASNPKTHLNILSWNAKQVHAKGNLKKVLSLSSSSSSSSSSSGGGFFSWLGSMSFSSSSPAPASASAASSAAAATATSSSSFSPTRDFTAVAVSPPGTSIVTTSAFSSSTSLSNIKATNLFGTDAAPTSSINNTSAAARGAATAIAAGAPSVEGVAASAFNIVPSSSSSAIAAATSTAVASTGSGQGPASGTAEAAAASSSPGFFSSLFRGNKVQDLANSSASSSSSNTNSMEERVKLEAELLLLKAKVSEVEKKLSALS